MRDHKKQKLFFQRALLAGLIMPLLLTASESIGQNRSEKTTIKARCEVYQDQFDKMRFSGKYDQHPKFDEAVKYRRLGESFCNRAYKAEGQKVLKHAIALLDAKPEKPGRVQNYYWTRE